MEQVVTLSDEQRLDDIVRRLADLRELEACPAWRNQVLPVIKKLCDDHHAGMSDLLSDRDMRAEHVRAWHSCRRIAGLIDELRGELEKEAQILREHS